MISHRDQGSHHTRHMELPCPGAVSGTLQDKEPLQGREGGKADKFACINAPIIAA